MKTQINNAEDAEMPLNIVKNCEELLKRQIKELPEIGSEFQVLYSEKDPLGEKDEVDDESYFIYFVVAEISPKGERNLDRTTIGFDLVF